MGNNAKGFEFKKFATPRIIGGIAIVVIILWALSTIFISSEGPTIKSRAVRQQDSTATAGHSAGAVQGKTASAVPADTANQAGSATHGTAGGHGAPAAKKSSDSHATATHAAPAAATQRPTTHSKTAAQQTSRSHGATAAGQTDTKVAESATHQPPAATAPHRAQASASDHGAAGKAATPHGTDAGHAAATSAVDTPVHKPAPKGVAFVEATIKPLNYELEERWWGWRPNDIIEFTDNVNTFQLGVLEVTRRTTVALAERISRTGSTDAFDENLEQAMNWFMIKASSYWFPSAESKYREGLEELQAYLEKLRAGNATFYTRTDNLIPLLASFEDLMGSCDENLVKQTNEDGTPLSTFDVDNYFYYTQGVASAMATVLEAVHHDFHLTLESRNATELLHHAIVSCQRAAELDPWIVLDRNLSSIFANHRANMAAPISHARFYLGQLIKTLST
jgi:hypothetical protein